MDVVYQTELDLTLEEFCSVLERSTLSDQRPMNDHPLLEGMLRNTDVLITARIEGQLVGLSRAITDFSYCTYLADLAVDVDFQKQGIGKELIDRTHAAAGRHTLLILLSAPAAETYYPHVGLQKHNSCWTIPRQLPDE